MRDESRSTGVGQSDVESDLRAAFSCDRAAIARVVKTLLPSSTRGGRPARIGGMPEAFVFTLAFPNIARAALGLGQHGTFVSIKSGFEKLGSSTFPLIVRVLEITESPAAFATNIAHAMVAWGAPCVLEFFHATPSSETADANRWWVLAAIVQRAASNRKVIMGERARQYRENVAVIRRELLMEGGRLSAIVTGAQVIIDKGLFEGPLRVELKERLTELEAHRASVVLAEAEGDALNVTWPEDAARLLATPEGVQGVVAQYLDRPSKGVRRVLVDAGAATVVPVVLALVASRRKGSSEPARDLLRDFAAQPEAYSFLLDALFQSRAQSGAGKKRRRKPR